VLRTHSRRSASDWICAPGAISCPVISFKGEVAINSRPLRIAANNPSRSCCADRKLKRIAGASAGSADFIWIDPVLSDRSTLMFMVMPRRFAIRLSWFTISYRKGSTEIVASGASKPARVRKYMRIGTAVRARKPSPNSAYFAASRTRRQPRALSLNVALRATISNFTRGE
jgi:hypothetical protein